jgi:transposase
MLAGMKREDIIRSQRAGDQMKHAVRLTAADRAALMQLVRVGTAPARKLLHARILLKADAGEGAPGWTDAQIRAALEVSLSTIARVRRRYATEGSDAALTRRPVRVPRPRKIDGLAEAHLIALACSTPPAGRDKWSLRLLADRFVTLDGGASVSHETIRRVMGKKRAQAVAGEGVVHPAEGERGLRLSDGRRAGRVRPAV